MSDFSLSRAIEHISPQYGTMVHRDFVLLEADDNYAHIMGYKNAEDIMKISSVLELINPENRKHAKQNHEYIISGNQKTEATIYKNINKQGEPVYVITIDTLIQYQGQPALKVTVVDVTKAIQAQQRLTEIENRYQEMVEASLQAMMVHINFKPLFCNLAYAQLLGYDKVSDVLALDSILPLIPEENHQSVIDENNALLAGDIDHTKYETSGFTSFDKKIWVTLFSKRIRWGSDYAVQVSAIDITEQYLLRQQIKHKATYDGLTQVMNRASVTEQLELEISNCKQDRMPLSVVLMDIDNFKQVNDTYGHEGGDVVLKEFSRHCKNGLRKGDVIGRWGGEEFILVLPGSTAEVACKLANRLKQQIADMRVELADRTLNITVSMGIASMQAHCRTGYRMVTRADKALYKAKQTGKNKVVLEDLPS